MGPNLKQLFETVKQNQISDDADVLVAIFERHGEALIAALEKALQCFEITQRVKDYPVDHWASKAQQLLAQLDLEARP